MSHIDNSDKRRRTKKSTELSAGIRSSIRHFQNPADCRAAKKLICRFENDTQGFGAAVQSSLTCLILSMYTNRTLILASKDWNYDARGLEVYFEPSGSCKISDVRGDVDVWDSENRTFAHEFWLKNNTQNIEILNKKSRKLLSFLKLPVNRLIPRFLMQEIQTFHNEPYAWYVAQIVSYLFRVNEKFLKKLLNSQKRLKFMEDSSTVG